MIQTKLQNILKVTSSLFPTLAIYGITILPKPVNANIINDIDSSLENDTLSSKDLDRITSVVYIDVKIANYTEESIGKNKAANGSGRLVIGLYGKDSPLSVARFLETIQSNGTNFPTYVNSQFGRIIDDTLLQIDDNQRLETATIAGEEQYQYQGTLLTDYKPILEANSLRHDR